MLWKLERLSDLTFPTRPALFISTRSSSSLLVPPPAGRKRCQRVSTLCRNHMDSVCLATSISSKYQGGWSPSWEPGLAIVMRLSAACKRPYQLPQLPFQAYSEHYDSVTHRILPLNSCPYARDSFFITPLGKARYIPVALLHKLHHLILKSVNIRKTRELFTLTVRSWAERFFSFKIKKIFFFELKIIQVVQE